MKKTLILLFVSFVFLLSSYYYKSVPSKEANNIEWEAFKTILSGDFSLIEDIEYRKHLETIYSWSIEDGKCTWKYILMDFNEDGINELFIQFSSECDSALFQYVEGEVKCVYIDRVEATCFILPLKDGRLLEEYNYWTAPSKTIYNFDNEFNIMVQECYFYINLDGYESYKDMKDYFDEMINKYSIAEKEGTHYLLQKYEGGKPFGNAVHLSEEEWQQAQTHINELLISDSEWKNCLDK